MPVSTHNHKSLAVLICGKTTGKTHAQNGDYIDIYNRFLRNSLGYHTTGSNPGNNNNKLNESSNEAPTWQFTLDAYNVFERQELPDEAKLDSLDAILITGSPATAYHDLEWINNLVAFVKHVADNKPHIKLIGICFGHQIIARALGGKCVSNTEGWEVGPTPITLTELGKELFGVESINIEEMHRDHVPAEGLPPSFHLLGSTLRAPNQGMVRFLPSSPSPPTHSLSKDKDTKKPVTPTARTPSPISDRTPLTPNLNVPLLSTVQILTVQGHPEWHEGVVTPLIEERMASGVIPKDRAEDALRKADLRNDGMSVVGRVVWTMLGSAGVEGGEGGGG
ncbi:cytoplasmic protein [Coprinopsis sp. MPI-PUGE-AT-0042]|nr:cytoplasmic protein [Coprinopsis sp. MPI-PUGE-AT-0042]